MKRVRLIRVQSSATETRGVLITTKNVLFTLEPPWKNNQLNISCIPKGEYKVRFSG